ncbi:MAG: hypothetical protein C5B54_07160, partial [Acidobacteria bacterium]
MYSKRSLLLVFICLSILFSATILKAATANNVLLITAENNPNRVNDAKAKLLATGLITNIDTFDGTAGTPSLALLEDEYGAVLIYGVQAWKDATAMGNVLAQYVDEGGGVVTARFDTAVCCQLLGNFNSNDYWAIEPSAFSGTYKTLGTILEPGHPILNGVS